MAKIRSHGWFLLAVMAVMLVALPVLTYPMGRDQGMYANIGRSILNGGSPYIDMWDIKPPPIYYVYAFAISTFGDGTWALRALDFLAFPVTALALYWLGVRLANRRVGAWAVLLFGVFYFTETFASLTQSDSLITLPMSLAVVAAFMAQDAKRASRRALVWSLLTGALCGLILWFKHYYALFVLALVLNQMLARRAFPVREAVAFACGGLLTGGTLLLYFWSLGMVDEMLIVAQGTAAYNAQGYDFATFIASMHNYLLFRWWHWGPLLLLAALWPLLSIADVYTHDGNDPPTKQRNWRLILFWLIAALAFALVQAKGFDTHWLPLLPALALLGADSLDRITQMKLQMKQLANRDLEQRAHSSASLHNTTVAIIGLSAVGLLLILANSTWARAWPYITGQESRVEYFARFQANDVKPGQSLQVVHYLQERVAPTDTLYIWGFRPEVYYMGNWRPATRFQAQFPLVADWYPEAWRQENVDQLWAAMPPYVLLLQADYMPWVTGRSEDSNTLSLEYTHFINFVMANYERETKLGDFYLWRRHSP